MHAGSIPARASISALSATGVSIRTRAASRDISIGRKRMPRQITVGQNSVLPMSDSVSAQRHEPKFSRSMTSLNASASTTTDNGTKLPSERRVSRRATISTARPAWIWRMVSGSPVPSPIQSMKR
ncbi:MAG: hypothetical protein ACK4ZY_10375 [Sphingomonas sp.]